MQNNNTEAINTELSQMTEDKSHKNNLLYLSLLLFILLLLSASVNVYSYYQNAKNIDENEILKQTPLELETKEGSENRNTDTNDFVEWSLISESNGMKLESGFVRIKAIRTTSNNHVRIQTRAFVKDVGEFYVVYPEQNEDISSSGSVWIKFIDGREEKIVDFDSSEFMTPDDFSIITIPHPRRTDVILVRLGLDYYSLKFDSLNTKVEKIDLAKKEYRHWEEIVGWYESNIVVSEKTNNSSDEDFDTDADVVRFWMAPISDLSKKTYLD